MSENTRSCFRMYELFSYLSGNRRTGSSETVRVLLAKCPTSALARLLAPLLLALKWKLLLVSRKLGRNERTASLPLKILPFKRGAICENIWMFWINCPRMALLAFCPLLKSQFQGRATLHLCVQGSNGPIQCKSGQHSTVRQSQLFYICVQREETLCSGFCFAAGWPKSGLCGIKHSMDLSDETFRTTTDDSIGKIPKRAKFFPVFCFFNFACCILFFSLFYD